MRSMEKKKVEKHEKLCCIWCQQKGGFFWLYNTGKSTNTNLTLVHQKDKVKERAFV